MILKIIENEIMSIDTIIEFDSIENTMAIDSISNTKVTGNIEFSPTTITYNLSVESLVNFTNEYEYNRTNVQLLFQIDEVEEINEENPHIIEKTLDLNAKIWENIIVEIFTLPYSSNVNNENVVITDEVEINSTVDERLSPLLQLLNSNEEV